MQIIYVVENDRKEEIASFTDLDKAKQLAYDLQSFGMQEYSIVELNDRTDYDAEAPHAAFSE